MWAIYDTQHYISSTVRLSVIMSSVIMLNVTMLGVVMLSVVTLNVIMLSGPFCYSDSRYAGCHYA